MKKNIGKYDKIIRIILALVLLTPIFFSSTSTLESVILAVGAVILLGTAFVNFCPVWHIFGISTRKKKK